MMQSDTYLTLGAEALGVYKERGSRFTAFAYPVRDEQQIKALVDGLRAQYHDARHHCYAWRLGMPDQMSGSPGEMGERFRVNDDGEPSGTAGRPIYGQILSRGLTDVLVVVVRYFGGTKLGVPGLIQAYRRATEDALNNAQIIEQQRKENFEVTFGYQAMNGVMQLVKGLGDGVQVLGQESKGVQCCMSLSVRLREAEEFRRRLSEIEGLSISVSV